MGTSSGAPPERGLRIERTPPRIRGKQRDGTLLLGHPDLLPHRRTVLLSLNLECHESYGQESAPKNEGDAEGGQPGTNHGMTPKEPHALVLSHLKPQGAILGFPPAELF